MTDDSLRKKIRRGEVVLGSFVKMTDPSSTEILGMLGYDFIIVDNEHVAMNKESITNIIRAAENTGLNTIIRPRDASKTEILQFLDAGATGVQVPNVDNYEEARKVIDSVKYYPIGKRGYAPSHRAAGYSLMDKQTYLKNSNDNTITVVHCESIECINNLDDILSIHDVDVVFIGPMDMSQAFGVPGNAKDPNVQEAFRKIEEKVIGSGKALGTVATNTGEALALMNKGYRYIAISSDQGFIVNAGREAIETLRNESQKVNQTKGEK